ncbi:MAG: hypothetical protein ABI175_28670 [Polyangiales bacterium]
MTGKTAVRAGLFAIVTALSFGAGNGCAPDNGPQGVRIATKYQGGPVIAFDLAKKPLPELPLPNDVGTWPDPTSRTGRRINVSLVAPTGIERNIREKFSSLEGWGTFAPITIPFDKPLDTDDLKSRHQDDDFEFTNDAIYLVNLKTGVPVPLDLGQNFPLTLKETARYWPNDPAKTEANLLFETREEDLNGNGRLDLGEDTDFDGVLDHPNFPGKIRPPNGVDGLLTFWESETNTLILRPMIPLEEMTEYAVVVTDRLHGVDDKKTPVQSPFEFIHHPSQRMAVERLAGAIDRRNDYYGFGTDTLSHVQFVFTFTTQPTSSDMFALRDGVYGKGKFDWIAREYPAEMKLIKAVGRVEADDPEGDPPDTFTCTDDSNTCKACKQRTDGSRFVAKIVPAMQDTIKSLVSDVFGFSGPAGTRLVQSFENIEYLAVGSMKVPWLLGEVTDVSPDATIDANFQTGEVKHSTDEVSFFMVVPKTTAEHKPPFPVALYGHGYTGNGTEGLLFANDLARHGIATIGMNAPGHGLVLSEGDATLAKALFSSSCLTPFAKAFEINRVRNLNGSKDSEGKPIIEERESGGDYWTSYVFHTRDMVRQAVIEQVMMIRLLRSFDGRTMDWKGNGAPVKAGDFDEDGTVDVGGPNVKYFAWGESLGGIISAVQGGVDPYLTATSPVASGGALTDIAGRSFQGGVVEAVQMRVMSPLIISVPAESRLDFLKGADGKIVLDSEGKPKLLPKALQTQTRCDAGQRSIRFFVVELNKEREIEIGCATEAEVGEGMDVVVLNESNNEQRCAKVTKVNSDFEGSAQFRIGVPASAGDKMQIVAFKPGAGKPQAVSSYGKGCLALPDATLTKQFVKFEGIGDGRCLDDSAGPVDASTCLTTYGTKTFAYGSALVSPADGYGLRRQSPDFRRMLMFSQIALEPADPITFAPFYYAKTKPNPDGNPSKPTAVLTINTVGDMNVPVNAGIALGRVQGAIPFLRPDNVAARDYPDYVAPQKLMDLWGGKTPNRVLLDNHVIEGISRLGRHPAGAKCAPNLSSFPDCKGATTFPDRTVCDNSLFDPENLSEGTIPFDPDHLANPLRLARIAKHASEADLQSTWGPRLALPWTPAAPLGASLQPFIVPGGVHGFDPPDPCKAWDDGNYLLNVLGHFFATDGTDLYYLSHPVTDPAKPESDHRCAAVTDPKDPKACNWAK